MPFRSPAGEPTKTIFHEGWRAARSRSRRLSRQERALFSLLLDSVESAWLHVRTLQHLHDRFRPGAVGVFAQVLDFIDDQVCDLFRDVAGQVAVFVPVAGGGLVGVRSPNFNDTDGDADQFVRFVAILRAACFDPEVPRSAATAVCEATTPLLTWYDQLQPLLKRAADAVQGA
jgi:hypothetical protein